MSVNYRRCDKCKFFANDYCKKRKKPIIFNDFLCKTFERKDMMNERKIFDAAIFVFGENAQEEVAIEEMAELTQAITHKHRGREHNIPEEIADVEIILEQLKIINKCSSEVEEIRKAKIKRLEDKVDECLDRCF